jgi:hypothetical protein
MSVPGQKFQNKLPAHLDLRARSGGQEIGIIEDLDDEKATMQRRFCVGEAVDNMRST